MNFCIDATLEILARTPKTLQSYLRGLGGEWLRRNYGPDTWSVHEVIGHLIWGERTDWMPRLRQILAHGDSTPFEPFDRDGHAELCKESSTQRLLVLFEEERAQNVAELRALSLTSVDLEKVGRHPAFGTVSAQQLLATWTVHDFNHISQISKAMAFQYRDSVGPWEEYLSILAPPNPR